MNTFWIIFGIIFLFLFILFINNMNSGFRAIANAIKYLEDEIKKNRK
jgi:hypothetical protein